MDFINYKGKEIFGISSCYKTQFDKRLDNLLDIQNNVIFLWDEGEGCLLTQGTQSVCTSHQRLRPTERPEFQVRNVSVNESGTRAMLWGPEGVAVLDLPWRCGPKLEFQDGNPEIVVRCRPVDQLDMAFEAEVVKVRWNPYSTYDSSLVVLTSDNSIYHLDVMPNDIVTIEILRVGNRPRSRQKTLAALGDTAVDFCFAPLFSEIVMRVPSCAILVLRGNGDVLLVFGGSDVWQALPIYPLPQENYLSDACSIVSMPGKPASVILATSRGIIYHTLLVPLDPDQVDVPADLRKYRLLVVESVSLDSGLLQDDPDDWSTLTLRLLLDPHHSRRYLVVQSTSVYSVLLNALHGVDNLIRNESSSKLPPSVVEYLTCSGNTFIGVVATQHSLLALDTENNVMSVPLRCLDPGVQDDFTPEENSTEKVSLTKELAQPWQQKIDQLLEESHVLPQIALPKEQMSREEQLAVIVRIGSLIRNTTIPRYHQIKTILDQRVKLIESLKVLLLKELERLEDTRMSVQQSAEDFADKIQNVSEESDELKERVQRVVRQVAEANPTLSDAELRLQENVVEIEGKLNHYQTSLEKLKKNCAYQELKISQEDEQKEIVLSNKQVTAIHGCLSLVGENIAQLVNRVNEINQLLGLDE